MPAFICKQPNGKYCRFSTVVDTVTHIDMTEEDYIEMCAERAREEARDVLAHYVKHFSDVKKYFRPNNNTVEEFNEFLRDVGDTEQLDPQEYK